eukprot:TRINITY_DN49884_c0_g1_i1.p1 TRINITY_DN49884_c0_g1~~TRINITY_DN49884_c0_g1_i1.p1  ORF type:complete len:315 (-),score=38.89 TRINITY_DN49884_c0_g1_i1:53-937(-)
MLAGSRCVGLCIIVCVASIVAYVSGGEFLSESEHENVVDDEAHVPARSVTREEKEYMKNCPFWLKLPGYYKRWKKPKNRNVFRTLHDVHNMTCRKKPTGAIERIAFVSTDAALAELKRMGEDPWFRNTSRQDKFKVHSMTQSLVLRWKERMFDYTNEQPEWDVWQPILEPALRAACDHYGYNFNEIEIYKAMVTRLPPKAQVGAHRDMTVALVFPHRLHWVISGEEGVDTFIGAEKISVKDGELFEFNNVDRHSVDNRGINHRIHVIFDLYPTRLPADAKLLQYQDTDTGDLEL